MTMVSTADFVAAAHIIGRAAGRRDLVVPSFRCPPRVVTATRTIRRRRAATGGEDAVVSIRVKGRPRDAVFADMIEGVVVTNDLTSHESDQLRTALWAEVAEGGRTPSCR